MATTQPAQRTGFDPEHLLDTCSGFTKRTKQQCTAHIGKNSRGSVRSKYLPTCGSHRKQQVHAGVCQAQQSDGTFCSQIFRWTPPYLQLCASHRDYVNHTAPCYFLKLPTELRQEIFRYLLPIRVITSERVYQSLRPHGQQGTRFSECSIHSDLHSPLHWIHLGFNREVYAEVKDVFFAVTTFMIDISRDGVTLCGHRILRPKGPDGSVYSSGDQKQSDRFIQNFPWPAVKRYSVNIRVSKQSTGHIQPDSTRFVWDEEVELYDIRDFVTVVVSGVLAKSRQPSTLEVHLVFRSFSWSEEVIMSNCKLLVGPLERLRRVRQPRLTGVKIDNMPSHTFDQHPQDDSSIFSDPLFGPGNAIFDAYATEWGNRIASHDPARTSPMTKLFTEFRAFHNKIAELEPGIVKQHGRYNYLHRARVAREQEDVAGFCAVRAELVEHWQDHVQIQKCKKRVVNDALSRMYDADYLLHGDQNVGSATK